jgi:cytoskeletal protein CcmA (bactofilin family)
MLTSTKSGVPEKDRNASVSAAEVIGRVVQHDQSWARSEPTTTTGTASCIGSDMSIVGNIECKGPAQVFGRIEGEVRASDLQISDGAQVEGSVIAQNVTVCGRVKGTIHAVRVKLQSGGAVEGDIFHRFLKDRRDGLRIQRTHRRASTPKARRKKARPQLRYRPLMPSWRMGRSTRLRTDFATKRTLPLIGSTIRVPRSSVASSVRRFLFCWARKSRDLP